MSDEKLTLESSAEIIDCFAVDFMTVERIAETYDKPAEEITNIIREFFRYLPKTLILEISLQIDKELEI